MAAISFETKWVNCLEDCPEDKIPGSLTVLPNRIFDDVFKVGGRAELPQLGKLLHATGQVMKGILQHTACFFSTPAAALNGKLFSELGFIYAEGQYCYEREDYLLTVKMEEEESELLWTIHVESTGISIPAHNIGMVLSRLIGSIQLMSERERRGSVI